MTREELEKNAFWVLGLEPGATRQEAERAGQKLLAQLTIGAASAATYATPWGPRPRDESLVRLALASLRDPGPRILSEFWAENAAEVSAPAPQPSFSQAPASIGWKGPWQD